MKGIKSYALAFAATIAAALGFSACQDHFDDPDLNRVPVATMEPNAEAIRAAKAMAYDLIPFILRGNYSLTILMACNFTFLISQEPADSVEEV